MTRSSTLLAGSLIGLGCAAPAVEPAEAALDGQVQLDDAAREAGFSLRVGGYCRLFDGEAAVDVPPEEWVLLGRWTDGVYDFQILYPPSGALLWVHGAEASIELMEGVHVDGAPAEVEHEEGTELGDR